MALKDLALKSIWERNRTMGGFGEKGKVVASALAASLLLSEAVLAESWSMLGFGLLPVKGLQFPGVDESVYGLNLALFGGKNKNMFGVSFATFAQYASEEAAGIQISGMYNGAASAREGLVQIGWANHVCDEGVGLQIGFMNISKEFTGLEVGALNLVGDDYKGLQIGVLNLQNPSVYGLRDFSGMQISAINAFNGELAGVQIGVLNFVEDKLQGVQIGGINWAKEMHGLQIGGVNSAREMLGVQIGGINWAREVRGIQIGAINIVVDDFTGLAIGAFNIFYDGNASFLPLMRLSFE